MRAVISANRSHFAVNRGTFDADNTFRDAKNRRFQQYSAGVLLLLLLPRQHSSSTPFYHHGYTLPRVCFRMTVIFKHFERCHRRKKCIIRTKNGC